MGQSVFSYSQPVEFFTADSRQRFQEFISSFQKPGELIGQQPDLCFSKYPYGDFLLLSQKEGTAECFTEEQKARLQKHFPSLSHYELPSVGHYANCLLTSCHLKKGQEGACLFSGIAYSKGRLVIGEKDLAEPVNSEDLFESAGSFSMVHILPDSITLSTDFFGLTHLFFSLVKKEW